MKEQLEKTRRIADMMCTAHAGMRDRLKRFATSVDIAVLAFSAFLLAHTFADVSKLELLAWLNLSYANWLGVLSIAIFALSLIQIRVNWKAKSEAHARSFAIYSEVKRDLSRLLSEPTLDEQSVSRILSRYDLAQDIGVELPESEFLKQKQRHKVKIFISAYLDDNPGASILLIRLKLFLRDTFGWDVIDSNKKTPSG